MRNLWRGYNLSVVLAILFVSCLILQAILNFFEWKGDAEAHGQALSMAEYLVFFGGRVFENLQSEFLQLFSMVVLTAFLVHKGSGEGKQNQEQADRIERKLAEIERRLS